MVPSPSGVPGAHTCVVSSHVPCPAQASVGVQLRAGSDDLQLKVQSLLQPSPSVALPSSHSSGAVTMPSPQRDADAGAAAAQHGAAAARAVVERRARLAGVVDAGLGAVARHCRRRSWRRRRMRIGRTACTDRHACRWPRRRRNPRSDRRRRCRTSFPCRPPRCHRRRRRRSRCSSTYSRPRTALPRPRSNAWAHLRRGHSYDETFVTF